MESVNQFIGENFTLVLHLYSNNNEKTYNLIKNFLFQILFLKRFRNFEYIRKNCVRIFIEVSSDYTTFYEDRML